MAEAVIWSHHIAVVHGSDVEDRSVQQAAGEPPPFAPHTSPRCRFFMTDAFGVPDGLSASARDAYEDARMQGLCHVGALEIAVRLDQEASDILDDGPHAAQRPLTPSSGGHSTSEPRT